MGKYRVEFLDNGLTHIQDRQSGLTGCFGPDGRFRSGNLYLTPILARFIIAVETGWAEPEVMEEFARLGWTVKVG